VAVLSVDLCGCLLSVICTVAQWTWYVFVVWCSGQTGSGSLKCWFVGDLMYVLYTVAQWTRYVFVVCCSGQTGSGQR
jgi:hypothetical protein